MAKKLLTAVLFLLFPYYSGAEIAVAGTLGTSKNNNDEHSFAYSVYLYHKIDDQSLIGINSGGQQGGYPLLASLFVRLPLGGIFLPVATGDMGYFFHKSDGGFTWKAGGGLDWKNGEHSSILILGGYESTPRANGIYTRLGVLLEF